ncbi:DUF6660 family protein [Roseivirga sp. E12]|uniref:DUF6660 family protein n=1 Tax=Roseivirga sp. E12 TaxID=2819237 RepID=UPI001ABC923E|nr:DUF6660 family protein [Roseivirga sp. E12]MBO3700730.1 hypothetical protein [Roseivirga sp. E12]
MQRIAAILSIFILLMSMAPCADAWKDSGCESEGICESSNEANEADDSDDCLPFCSCMCCTAITTIALQSFEFQKIVITTDDLKLEEIAYNPPAIDIWQPPKI